MSAVRVGALLVSLSVACARQPMAQQPVVVEPDVVARAPSPIAQATSAQRDARREWAATHGSWVEAHDRALASLAARQAPDGSFLPPGARGRDAAHVAATAAA